MTAVDISSEQLARARQAAPGATFIQSDMMALDIPGESFAAAARRELLEETGLDCEPGAAIAARGNDFVTAIGEPVTADERYFRVRVPACEIATHGHTELEREIMQDHRWFTRAELADWPEPIFPPEILDLLDREAA